MKNLLLSGLSLCALLMVGCRPNKNPVDSRPVIHYPTPIPKEIPLDFLPEVVSVNGLDFNACFSLEGDKFYFSRSKNGKYIIYETRFDGKNWSTPFYSELFDSLYSNTDPFITRDGTIYFISNRPKNATDTIKDYDIYKLPKGVDGYDSAFNVMEVNSDSTEYYVSLAENGNLYFASYRDGNLDLYFSEMTDQGLSKPTIISNLNSEFNEHDPLIASDETFIIFTSDRPGGLGEADLYISEPLNGGWKKPINMGKQINTASYDYCPYITPDGKFFFYSSDWNVKWVDSKILQAQ